MNTKQFFRARVNSIVLVVSLEEVLSAKSILHATN